MTRDKHYSKPGASNSRPPKAKPLQPVEIAIRSWLQCLPAEPLSISLSSISHAISSAPKRWAVYLPMVLLPSGSFSEEWWSPFNDFVTAEHRNELWKIILSEIGKREGKGILSHLAINAGIPLQKPHQLSKDSTSHEPVYENILRTPSGLIMLHGDFGRPLPPSHVPSDQDFTESFWVSTKQNGITQVWAPRHTMFSRGNVKEKARLLEFHSSEIGLKARRLERMQIERSVALDLYAGIGYFVFSYVKAGMERVIGWELNPWSVEGLRRGARANGWDVRVVLPREEVSELDESRIVIFLEDNRSAVERLTGIKGFDLGSVRHVNCGLLPSSELSWRTALVSSKGNAWLHLHENLGTKDVEKREGEIESIFNGWLKEDNDRRAAKVEHVEFVKTFAPDVWHCVFDLYISGHKT